VLGLVLVLGPGPGLGFGLGLGLGRGSELASVPAPSATAFSGAVLSEALSGEEPMARRIVAMWLGHAPRQ